MWSRLSGFYIRGTFLHSWVAWMYTCPSFRYRAVCLESYRAYGPKDRRQAQEVGVDMITPSPVCGCRVPKLRNPKPETSSFHLGFRGFGV